MSSANTFAPVFPQITATTCFQQKFLKIKICGKWSLKDSQDILTSL